MSNTPQPISITFAVGALSRLKKLTRHHILMQSMITDFLSKEEERNMISEAAVSDPEFAEAHGQLAVMHRQFEDAGTMLLTMSLEIARKIAAEESTLSGFLCFAGTVRRLKRARMNQSIN
ncbi:uncharacterized protein H6S33_004897 [Morchella sextelata]|uniref:uncharacterized protein n=1 Tax=Morchella sextelata TaxID=1174677 RepID=UPI001D043858|nr:uncharacterized protein H6S33_004897 [Morchella sextelata]KAH0605675.1 hypothetical protein H6S33_004897 [Morchella sextelata]